MLIEILYSALTCRITEESTTHSNPGQGPPNPFIESNLKAKLSVDSDASKQIHGVEIS